MDSFLYAQKSVERTFWIFELRTIETVMINIKYLTTFFKKFYCRESRNLNSFSDSNQQSDRRLNTGIEKPFRTDWNSKSSDTIYQ